MVPTVAWLGLIWSTWQIWQIAFRTLSKHKERGKPKESDRHKIAPSLFQYVVGLVIFFALINDLRAAPVITGLFVLVASILTLAFLAWEYRLIRTRPSEDGRISQVMGVLSFVNFVVACVTEVLSLYILYGAGYLMGAYDSILLIGVELGLSANQVSQKLAAVLPDLLPTVHKGVPLSLVGIAVSTILIALFAYRQGVIRGRKQIK